MLPLFTRLLDERVKVFESYDAHINRVLEQIEAAQSRCDDLQVRHPSMCTASTTLPCTPVHTYMPPMRLLQGRIEELEASLKETVDKAQALRNARFQKQAEIRLLEARQKKLTATRDDKRRLARKLEAQAQLEIGPVLPVLERAQQEVNKLDKLAIAEIKSFHNPPALVLMVLEAVMVMLGESTAWGDARVVLSDQHFLQRLLQVGSYLGSMALQWSCDSCGAFVCAWPEQYNSEGIPESSLRKMERDYLKRADFTPSRVNTHSVAAGVLCQWVLAITSYGLVLRKIKGLKSELDDANAVLAEAEEELQTLVVRRCHHHMPPTT